MKVMNEANSEKAIRFLKQREEHRRRLEEEWPRYKEQQPECSRRLTSELRALKRRFSPWIGGCYCDSGLRIKVLVVGDSTYLGPLPAPVFEREYDDDGTDWFNKNAIFPYRNEYWGDAYFTKWTNALVGESVEHRDRRQFRRGVLDSVAFYNFCDSILERAGVCPEPDAFVKARPIFGQILETLKPHLVILTAYRVRDVLSNRAPYGGAWETYDGGYSLIRPPKGPSLLCLPHPNGGRRWWKKNQVHAAVLDSITLLGGNLYRAG